ncbi:MAG: PEP-utilizing enzyme [bacterium]
MKKYIEGHEEHAITPLTISPVHNTWSSKILIKLLDGRKTGVNTFCIHENRSIKFFMDEKAWDEGSDYLIGKIQTNPRFVKLVKKKSEKYARELVKKVRQAELQVIKKWSNRQLADFLLKSYQMITVFTAYGYVPVLSDHYFNKYTLLLKTIVKKAVEKKSFNLSIPEAVSILSTPRQPIPSRLARVDLLKLALRKPNHIVIKKYYQKWFFVNFGHLGPRTTLLETEKAVEKLSRNKVQTKKELKELQDYRTNLVRKQAVLMGKLNLNVKEKYLFQVARNFTYLKGLRMEILFGAFAQWERILNETGKRYSIPKKLLYYCSAIELADLLINNKIIPKKKLKEREKFCVWVANSEDTQQILTGKKAREYLRNHAKKVKPKVKDVLVIHGTVASVGFAEGPVKIVNRTSEIKKVNKGDIMISVATHPALLPAMEKAAAFVTDIGGLTSHAAIVAREMKKPCIIGTKIATKVLNDGDKVEVDAKKGDVKKI